MTTNAVCDSRSAVTVSAMPSPIQSSASRPEMFVNGMTATSSGGAPAVDADCICGPAGIVDGGTKPAPVAGADRASPTTRDTMPDRYVRMKNDSDEAVTLKWIHWSDP